MSSETLSSLELAILVRKQRRAQHLAEGYPELNSACTCTPRLLFSHCTGGNNISLQPNPFPSRILFSMSSKRHDVGQTATASKALFNFVVEGD